MMQPEWYEIVVPYLYFDKESEEYKKYGEPSIREDAPPRAKELYEDHLKMRERGLK